MKPVLALAIVGAGAVAVYVSTRPGGWSGVLGDLGLVPAPPNAAGISAAEIERLTGGFATHLSPGEAAGVGASIGSAFAGPTLGISIAVGAAIGYLGARQSNDTREDRDEFARRLGLVPDATHTPAGRLYDLLDSIGRNDLTVVGRNAIGRHDFEGNQRWMLDVIAALQTAGLGTGR